MAPLAVVGVAMEGPASAPSGSSSRSLTWKDLDLRVYPLYATLYIAATDFILYPADLITTRLQNDKASPETFPGR